MASIKIFVALALVSAIIAPALATDFVVGDDAGWKTNFDYKTWAADKEFHVGDKLSMSITCIYLIILKQHGQLF